MDTTMIGGGETINANIQKDDSDDAGTTIELTTCSKKEETQAFIVPNANPNSLIGEYIHLTKVFENNKSVTFKIENITPSPPSIKDRDETENENDSGLPDLVMESTNQWLFDVDCNAYNFGVAVTVICIQMIAYAMLIYFVIESYQNDIDDRKENCYGPHCDIKEKKCMHIATGMVSMIILVGYVWADFIVTCQMICGCGSQASCDRKSTAVAICILFEIIAAVACGVVVALNTPSDFDAINGAVGILFVHDLDEKIYVAMTTIKNCCHKIPVLDCCASMFWIVVAIVIAFPAGCRYSDGDWFAYGHCIKDSEFECGEAECVWYGFVCNGVEDCANGADEAVDCDFTLITCPDDMFRCNNGACIDASKQCNGIRDCLDGSDELFIEELNANTSFRCESSGRCIDISKQCNGVRDCLDGSDELYIEALNANDMFQCKHNGMCIDIDKRCDGILDCGDGSDEAKDQNCSALIADIVCGDLIANFEYKYPDNDWYLVPTNGSMFKCSNGQCIDGKYVCDGNVDCVDGSDEYPHFGVKADLNEFPFENACPYARLIECEVDEVLCKINGKCISKMRLCDGDTDCPDAQDEQGCQESHNSRCEIFNFADAIKSFQCGSNFAKINETHIVLTNETIYDVVYFSWLTKALVNHTDKNSSAVKDSTAYVVEGSAENATCVSLGDIGRERPKLNKLYTNFSLDLHFDPNCTTTIWDAGWYIFKQYETELSTRCIPIQFRCDGIIDCPDGSDEQLCHLFECDEDEYQCSVSGKCIPNHWICDSVCDCESCSDENATLHSVDYEAKCLEMQNNTWPWGTVMYCNEFHDVWITEDSQQVQRYDIRILDTDNYTKAIFTTCYENTTAFRTLMYVQDENFVDFGTLLPESCGNGFANTVEIDLSDAFAWGYGEYQNMKYPQELFEAYITPLAKKEAQGAYRFHVFCE